jgi:hypothetical protein
LNAVMTDPRVRVLIVTGAVSETLRSRELCPTRWPASASATVQPLARTLAEKDPITLRMCKELYKIDIPLDYDPMYAFGHDKVAQSELLQRIAEAAQSDLPQGNAASRYPGRFRCRPRAADRPGGVRVGVDRRLLQHARESRHRVGVHREVCTLEDRTLTTVEHVDEDAHFAGGADGRES